MAHTAKDNRYSDGSLQRSGFQMKWEARQRALKIQQANCTHRNYVTYSSSFGAYNVCTCCDAHLGFVPVKA